MLPTPETGHTVMDLSRRLCLLEGKYYHQGSTLCSDLFDESHCKPGFSWLLSTSVSGELQCQEIREDLFNCAEAGIDEEETVADAYSYSGGQTAQRTRF